MFEVLGHFVLFLAIFQAVFAGENDLKSGTKHSKEKLSISVKIIEEEDSANGRRETEVIVKLNITIQEDSVRINGKLTELDVLTKYDLTAEIVYSAKDVRILPVIIHVMVMRKELESGHQYLIEEQVQFINEKRVEQVDVQVLTIHMDVNGKEFRRTIAAVKFEESNIKKAELSRYCGKNDKKPKRFLDPSLPDEKGYGHHHKHHHGKSLCSSLARELQFLSAWLLVVLASMMCCAMCCCRKSKKAYEISKGNEEFWWMKAEPLPEKLAFDDKEVLIA
ncbi:uncharacterized protein LOC114541665 [Dendronephthya gigantea]|uniref:uncharacterized protein LOC114541665 n=1 Tax=Dendronephthya gigantea TaxID=151771 RepID=UPI001068E771|nr:uncharacterized protein LOC114541665 [Dendronephthya gigantea]